jgi:hypothetical protein
VFETEYRPNLPDDPALSRLALRALGAAPVGTTDSFVQSLLAEFALDAALPLFEGRVAPLDRAGRAPGQISDAFAVAARELVDPPGGEVPEEAKRCLRLLTLETLLARVAELAANPPGVTQDLGPLLDRARRVMAAAARAAQQVNPKLGWNSAPDATPADKDAALDWLCGPASAELPLEAFRFFAHRLAGGKAGDKTALQDQLAGVSVDFGLATLDATRFVKCFPVDCIGSLDAARQLRSDLVALASRTRDQALVLAAASGALDYGLLTEAAIHLCKHPPERLRNRFAAILVDEAQDASPEQMELYEALSRLPGGDQTLHTVYVGDPRQSIYLFRGAEPRVLEGHEARAREAGTLETLDVNFRSTDSLVRAQVAVFGRLSNGFGGRAEDDEEGGETAASPIAGLAGVKSIAGVSSDIAHPKRELAAHLRVAQPVLVLLAAPDTEWRSDQADDAAVDAFAERLLDVWTNERPGDPSAARESAAVLTHSWKGALRARDRLRVLLGSPDRAFLEGDRDLLNARTARDLRLLVRALWVSTDTVAWAGLYKMPIVGLSDAALARIAAREGVLPAPARAEGDDPTHFGGFTAPIWGAGLDPAVHLPEDVAAMGAIQPVLRRALERIGRAPTSEVVEEVAGALHWRTAILAGPEGEDGLAQLEVMIDWIRQAEAGGVDPDAVIELLDPDAGEPEIPRVALHRPPGSVACTTVFQAKGLKYDHVCVLRVGASGQGGPGQGEARVALPRDGVTGAGEASLIGVRFDPDGGLSDRDDAAGRLAAALAEARRTEERLRVFYVAFTRAVRSVTFGLIPGGGSGIHGQIGTLFQASAPHPVEVSGTDSAQAVTWSKAPLPAGDELPGVAFSYRPAPRPLAVAPRIDVVATHDFAERAVAPPAWTLAAPSSASDLESDMRAKALVQAVADKANFAGHHPAPEEIPGPAGITDASERGTMRHLWMEAGGLVGPAQEAEARAFVVAHPEYDKAGVVEHLVAVSRELRARLPAVYALLSRPDLERVFELPIVGVAEGDDGERRLYSGNIDLLLVEPDGKAAWVIDFKGKDAPLSREQLVSHGEFRKYVLQVEAYRRSLEKMGYTVRGCGLLFLGTMVWVGW